jgi:lysyl-tRNA synthetase class 1
VFEREPPINVPYEFLLIGGRKMSTSKGQGASAQQIVEVVPPEQLRLLFLRPKPNTAIEFEPDGTDAIPRLFDEFDRLAAATAGREVKGELPPGYEAMFRYSLVDPTADVATEAALFRPAFSHLAMLAQVPAVDIVGRVRDEKGSDLDAAELLILQERLRSARAWLETYAPERARMEVRSSLPEEAAALDDTQRAYLEALAAVAAPVAAPTTPVARPAIRGGDAWQAAIFESAAERELPAARAFEAIYLAFLGRRNGPRAGWLLAGLDQAFVVARLRAAAQVPVEVPG